MKSCFGFGWMGVVVGSWALLGCDAEDIEIGRPETAVGALQPKEPTQLLPYDCRQDETKKSTPPGSAASLPKTFRQTDRLVGVAVSGGRLTDEPEYGKTIATQFSQLTPENEMKWETIEPEQGVFDFGPADAIVQFAKDNGMKVRGHTLVWHSQLPAWMSDMTGTDAVRAALTNHIQTVVAHFRDTFPETVLAYDVVNEAVNITNVPAPAAMPGAVPPGVPPGVPAAGMQPAMPPAMNIYRDSVFSRELGQGFIAEAFQIAHDTDPKALLFYNDFGVEASTGAKSNGMFTIVSGMVNAGVPINGVGFQMHTGPIDQGPAASDFGTNIARYSDLGLMVEVTEMDVPLCNVANNPLAFELQRYRYNRIVSACFDSPACRSVTLWGLGDANSWLNTNGCTQGMVTLDTQPTPLAFDDLYARKAAWWGIYDALSGCTYR